MSRQSAPGTRRSDTRTSPRLSPYRIALHEALMRNIAGLGFQILRVLWAHNCTLSSRVEGRRVRETILGGVEGIARDIVSGTIPDSVAELHTSPRDENGEGLCETLERLITKIAEVQRTKSADLPAGSRWPKETLLPVEELLPDIAEPETNTSANLSRRRIPILDERDPEELRRLLERELWRRLNRTQSEAWHVPTQDRREHLNTLPQAARRFVKRELRLIAMTTTGEHVVDRIASRQRICAPAGA